MPPRKRSRVPLSIRLWAKIDKAGPDDCWVWTAARDRKNYGVVSAGGKKGALYAHRAVYEDAVGPIPPGLHILHRCDNPPCCNPAHLWAGTNSQNIADMISKGRSKGAFCFGEEHMNHKLTREKVLEIRASTDPERVVARRYGISGANVHAIRKRKTWKHI